MIIFQLFVHASFSIYEQLMRCFILFFCTILIVFKELETGSSLAIFWFKELRFQKSSFISHALLNIFWKSKSVFGYIYWVKVKMNVNLFYRFFSYFFSYLCRCFERVFFNTQVNWSKSPIITIMNNLPKIKV